MSISSLVLPLTLGAWLNSFVFYKCRVKKKKTIRFGHNVGQSAGNAISEPRPYRSQGVCHLVGKLANLRWPCGKWYEEFVLTPPSVGVSRSTPPLPPLLLRTKGKTNAKCGMLTISHLETAFDCLKAAYEAGINFFDTAEGYSGGQSEILLGEAIKKFGWKQNDLVISTKVRDRSTGVLPCILFRQHPTLHPS